MGGSGRARRAGAHQHFDAAGEARLTPDQSGGLQREYDLMNRGRGHLEVALGIGLGWRPTVDPHVGIDEGQVLTLRVGEAGLRKRIRQTVDSSGPLSRKRPMNIRYRVDLSEAERCELQALTDLFFSINRANRS